MDMIWHYNKRININMFKMFRYMMPVVKEQVDYHNSDK